MRASTSNSTLPLTTPCPTRGRTSMHASWIFHQWDCPCCLATNACSRCLLMAAMSPCRHGNAREAAPLMDWEGAVKELGPSCRRGGGRQVLSVGRRTLCSPCTSSRAEMKSKRESGHLGGGGGATVSAHTDVRTYVSIRPSPDPTSTMHY